MQFFKKRKLTNYISKKISQGIYYTLFTTVVYLVYIYPFYCLSHLYLGTNLFNFWSIPITFLVAFLIVLFFRTEIAVWPLKSFVYWGLGIGFISLWIFSLGLLVSMTSNIDSHFIGIACTIILSLILIYGYYNCNRVFLKEFAIPSSKIDQEIQFVFISDTHLGSNSEKHLIKIKELLDRTDFEFLVIGGDFFDSSSYRLETLNLIKHLARPILFITGNHEYYLKDYDSMLKKLSEFGIKILDNVAVQFGGLNIIGVDEGQNIERQKDVIKQHKEEGKFNIAVVHKPFLWARDFSDADLTLAGHTHNGQIIPFNLFVRLQTRFLYGLYQGAESWLYVSCGSGCWGPRLRLGSQNEIVLVKLLPKMFK